MNIQIVTDDPLAWQHLLDPTLIISAHDYLAAKSSLSTKSRIINLCSDYRYQSLGYYVSLMAEARQHKVIPSTIALRDCYLTNTISMINDDCENDIQKSLRHIQSNHFELSIYFGKNIAESHQELARKIHGLLPLPLFKITFVKTKSWKALKLQPISLTRIPASHHDFLRAVLTDYLSRRMPMHKTKKITAYDLAILYDEKEKNLSSNKKAIEQFIKTGRKLGFNVDLIQRNDFKTILEYDALFIRETTAVNHYTYHFARKAAAEQMVVIDDPTSILRCSNKVYLAEFLKKHRVNTPKTYIIHRENYQQILADINYPCVIKTPDSAFSLGVVKAANQQYAYHYCQDFFKKSSLLIIQEYMPTEFDWRIGIIDKKPLFACRYYMANSHWQIYNWNNKKKSDQSGNFDTLPITEVPSHVLDTAIKATKLIGNGLYGVDIKEIDGVAYVIEVNDNPNIDHGIEDRHLGNELYVTVLSVIKQRLDSNHGFN